VAEPRDCFNPKGDWVVMAHKLDDAGYVEQVRESMKSASFLYRTWALSRVLKRDGSPSRRLCVLKKSTKTLTEALASNSSLWNEEICSNGQPSQSGDSLRHSVYAITTQVAKCLDIAQTAPPRF
jgi:hypothetical protein